VSVKFLTLSGKHPIQSFCTCTQHLQAQLGWLWIFIFFFVFPKSQNDIFFNIYNIGFFDGDRISSDSRYLFNDDADNDDDDECDDDDEEFGDGDIGLDEVDEVVEASETMEETEKVESESGTFQYFSLTWKK